VMTYSVEHLSPEVRLPPPVQIAVIDLHRRHVRKMLLQPDARTRAVPSLLRQ
jgi:hypothetical protein